METKPKKKFFANHSKSSAAVVSNRRALASEFAFARGWFVSVVGLRALRGVE